MVGTSQRSRTTTIETKGHAKASCKVPIKAMVSTAVSVTTRVAIVPVVLLLPHADTHDGNETMRASMLKSDFKITAL